MRALLPAPRVVAFETGGAEYFDGKAETQKILQNGLLII